MLIMLKLIIKNLKLFFILWGIILFLNQLFIFGACFHPYCILAGLPHTAFISAVILSFIIKDQVDELNKELLAIQAKQRANLSKLKSAGKIEENKDTTKRKIIEIRKSEYELLLEKKSNGKLTTFEKSKLEYLEDYKLRAD